MNPKQIKGTCYILPGMFKKNMYRKANKSGPGKILPFLQAAWSNCGMTVLKGPEESADLPILSDFNERKISLAKKQNIWNT